MVLADAPACTTTVAAVSASNGSLPNTGLDVGVWLLLGVGLVLAGVVLFAILGRKRPVVLALVIGAAVAGLLVGGSPSGSASAAQSAAAGECSLIQATDVVRADATELLPGGQPVTVLDYTVDNVTDLPIEITVSTVVTGDPGHAAFMVAIIETDPAAASVTGSLDAVPTLGPIALAPGQTIRVTYRIGLASSAGNAAQNAHVSFDSVITSTQL